MRVFISYAFNETNRWVEELVIPLAKNLGFEVVSGQRMEGEALVEAIDQRLRSCSGCIAFTTRRSKRPDDTYETHPWVVNEMTQARALGFKTVEVRESGVRIGDGAEAYIRLEYIEAQRDRLLIELVGILASWITKPVLVQLLPPPERIHEFTGRVIRGDAACSFQLKSGNQPIKSGEALIQPIRGGFFIEIESPPKEAIVTLEVKKPNNNGAWMSFGDGLIAIPVQLYDSER
jgi:hypothetical protein